MLAKLYGKWMYRWETALTTLDSNRVVRPVEWGFDWLEDFTRRYQSPGGHVAGSDAEEEQAMLAVNDLILQHRADFFAYQDARGFCSRRAAPAIVSHQRAAGNPAPGRVVSPPRRGGQPAQGAVSALYLADSLALPGERPGECPLVSRAPAQDGRQAEAGDYRHAALECRCVQPQCALLDVQQVWRLGTAPEQALPRHPAARGAGASRLRGQRQRRPHHRFRPPGGGRHSLLHRLARQQGYEQFGILGTSLGSCYAFLASAMDRRIRVAAFNHASMSFGDVVWTGQSTRHIREAFEAIGMTHQRLRDVWAAISPSHYMEQFAANPRKILLVHATYDLTFLREYSLQVVENFRRRGIDFVSKVLPCGHYTTGETPYKFMDGWYLGSFVYSAFKELAGACRYRFELSSRLLSTLGVV